MSDPRESAFVRRLSSTYRCHHLDGARSLGSTLDRSRSVDFIIMYLSMLGCVLGIGVRRLVNSHRASLPGASGPRLVPVRTSANWLRRIAGRRRR